MKLDYNSANGAFILRVPRLEADPMTLMEEHGLDFSASASTPGEAVLSTREPYAAVAFFEHATSAAKAQLQALQTAIDASWKQGSEAHIKVPYDKELWPFQKAGVEYALGRKNTLIGDQPGLGKTAQAIAFANEISAKSVLVIVPAGIRLQWVKAIREWSTMDAPVIYPILIGKHGTHPSAEWTVVSYDLARTPAIGRALTERTYDLMILDEGHYLKTISSQRTRAVFGGGLDRTFPAIQSRVGATLSLTGTPLPNRPREAYTQIRGLDWDAADWMSEETFNERFNPSLTRETEEGKIYVDERTGRHGELQARLRANIMVRRKKRDVMPQLKLPLLDIVHIEEDAQVRQALKAESLLDIDPENLEGADAIVLGHIAVVRRMMGVALAPHVAEYARMVLDGGEEKIVIFAHHHEVLDILQKELSRYGLVRYDGRASNSQKQARKEQFITDRGTRVFLANTISAGTGTDGLQTVCTHAIFAEADWTAGNNEQAVDRLDRGGQEGQVQAEFCVARGSFSERVLASALRKNQTTYKALDRRM